MKGMIAFIIIVLLVVVGYFVVKDKISAPAANPTQEVGADDTKPAEEVPVSENTPAPVIPECKVVSVKAQPAGHPRAVWAFMTIEFDKPVKQFSFVYSDGNMERDGLFKRKPGPIKCQINTPDKKWKIAFENYGYIFYSIESGIFVDNGTEYDFSIPSTAISWEGQDINYPYDLSHNTLSVSIKEWNPIKLAIAPNTWVPGESKLVDVHVAYLANYFYRSSLGTSSVPDSDEMIFDIPKTVDFGDGSQASLDVIIDRNYLINLAGDKVDRIEGYFVVTEVIYNPSISSNEVFANKIPISLPGKASSLQ